LFEFENFVQLQIKKRPSEVREQETSSDEENYMEAALNTKELKTKKKKRKPITHNQHHSDLKINSVKPGPANQTAGGLQKKEQLKQKTSSIYTEKNPPNLTIYNPPSGQKLEPAICP